MTPCSQLSGQDVQCVCRVCCMEGSRKLTLSEMAVVLAHKHTANIRVRKHFILTVRVFWIARLKKDGLCLRCSQHSEYALTINS